MLMQDEVAGGMGSTLHHVKCLGRKELTRMYVQDISLELVKIVLCVLQQGTGKMTPKLFEIKIKIKY